ncbi:MAG: bifunctional metallophosphatase/5'-nucleotidase [Brevinema sp.]
MKIFLLILLFYTASCGQKQTEISLLHINDTHSKHYPFITKDNSTNGGSAQLAYLIKKYKSEQSNILAIHGGDAVTGSAFSIVYQGMDSTDILNLSDFDLAVLGNHEFDFGLNQAYNIINARNFPTIAANAYEKDTDKAIVEPYFITNINGKSIAFLGLLTSHEVYTHKDKAGQFTVQEEMSALSNVLDNSASWNTNDLLILVSHSGYEVDKEIARNFPNVFDVIIGGHSHTYLEQPDKINNTLIVQLNSNIQELGKLDLVLDAKNKIRSYRYQAIPIKNIPTDPDVLAYIESKEELVNQNMGQVLATISDTLSDSNIRKQSTILGNFIADTVFNAFSERNLDILMLNSGGIRAPLVAGNITLGTMYEIHPFDNTVIYFEATGDSIKQILSHSASSVYDTGGFVQIAQDVEVVVESDKSISSITIKGEPIESDKIYKVMASDWIFHGGDSYTMIKENAQNVQLLGFDVREILMKEFQKIKHIDVTKLSDAPRWVIKK